jgi:hypothetical protein
MKRFADFKTIQAPKHQKKVLEEVGNIITEAPRLKHPGSEMEGRVKRLKPAALSENYEEMDGDEAPEKPDAQMDGLSTSFVKQCKIVESPDANEASFLKALQDKKQEDTSLGMRKGVFPRAERLLPKKNLREDDGGVLGRI